MFDNIQEMPNESRGRHHDGDIDQRAIADALRAAGSMTSAAYSYATEFTRERVRKTQEISYERALRGVETDISRNQAKQRIMSTEEVCTQAATAQTSSRLGQVRPSGRVVPQLEPSGTTLPDLPLKTLVY